MQQGDPRHNAKLSSFTDLSLSFPDVVMCYLKLTFLAARIRDLTGQVEHFRSKYTQVNRRRKLEIQGNVAAAQLHRQEIDSLRRSVRKNKTFLPEGDENYNGSNSGSGSGTASSSSSDVNFGNNNDNEKVKYLESRVKMMERQMRELIA